MFNGSKANLGTSQGNSVTIQAPAWPVIAFMLKCLVLVLLVGAVTSHFSMALGETLLPALRAELVWLDDHYRIKDLCVGHEGGDEVIRLKVNQARHIVIRDTVFPPHPSGNAIASTLLGNLVSTAVLLVSLVLAWPSKGWLCTVLRALILPFAVAFVWAIDVPMILWGAIWSLHVDAFAPDLLSPLLIWCQFLQGGGRFAVTALIATSIGIGTNHLKLPRFLGKFHKG